MVLAEATVRVTLDVSRFDRELREKVEQAANRAGRDFDRAMKSQMAATAKTAATEFRNATRAGMVRAGAAAAEGFDVSFRKGINQLAGRVGQRLGQGLRVSVGRAGLDAGRRFAENISSVLERSGQATGRGYVDAIRQGINSSAANIGQSAARSLRQGTRGAAAEAGTAAGRQFAVSFDIGIGSARVGRPLLIALAAMSSAVVGQLGPATGIVAGIAPLLGAVTVGAGVAAVAVLGLSDAFSAISDANFEKLDAAMQRLSPAAQALVREFAAMRPELRGLQQDIANAFLGQLAGQITNVTQLLTGPLRAGILEVGVSAGRMADQFLSAFSDPDNIDNLNDMLRGTSRLFDQLTPGVRNLTNGILDFVGAAAPGLNDIGDAIGRMLTQFGRWLSEMASSGQALQWVHEGIEGLRNLADTFGDIVQILGALAAAARPLLFAMGGLFDIMAAIASVFEMLPGPVQTLALAMLLLSRIDVAGFFSRIGDAGRSSVGVLTTMAAAYRNTTTSLREFTSFTTEMVTRVGQAPTVLQRLRDSVSGLTTVAAGAGAALRVGVGAAVSGLVSVLGGPWGVALAAASVGLSLLAGAQSQARQEAAAHRAEISELADTLNKQTGAVTQASVAMRAKDLAEQGLIDRARSLNVSATDFTNATLGQVSAMQRVNQQLMQNAQATVMSTGFYQRYGAELNKVGITLADLEAVSLGNEEATKNVGKALADNIGTLGITQEDWRNYSQQLQTAAGDNKALADIIDRLNGDLKTAQGQVAQQAAVMTPAQIAAQKYADAVGILADNTADADAKARALNEALQILAGGTIDAEVAQGRFTELLATMNEQLGTSIANLQGMGAAMITAEGRINTQTQAGAFLIDVHRQLTDSLAASAAATLEAGRASGNLDAAYLRIAQDTQAARAQFIATAEAMNIPRAQAEQLANAYGLIPAQVLTTVTDSGTALNTQAHVASVYQQLKGLPPNTPVTVTGLTQDAMAKLRDVGITVRELPDGRVEVVAETQQANNALANLVNSWSGTVIDFIANVAGGNAMGGIVPNAAGNVLAFRNGGHHLRKMPANRAEIVAPNTWRVVGDRAVGDEAYIPITGSARSRAILNTTARRMGFDLVPAGQARRLESSTRPTLNVQEGAILVNAPYADPELVARATINELARYAVT